jgi:hypothetical protein
LFSGTRVSNLCTAVDTPAKAAWLHNRALRATASLCPFRTKRNEDGDGEGLRRRGGWTVGKEHRSRLVHTGLGSLTPIAHVLPYPPPLTRTALYQVLQYNNKHTHRGMKGVCVRKFVQVAKLHLLRLVCSSNPEDTNYEIETQSGFGPVSHCVL